MRSNALESVTLSESMLLTLSRDSRTSYTCTLESRFHRLRILKSSPTSSTLRSLTRAVDFWLLS